MLEKLISRSCDQGLPFVLCFSFYFLVSMSFTSDRRGKKVSACFGIFSSNMKECCREIREQNLGTGHPCCRLLLYEFKSLSIKPLYIYFNYYLS